MSDVEDVIVYVDVPLLSFGFSLGILLLHIVIILLIPTVKINLTRTFWVPDASVGPYPVRALQ